MAVLAWGRGLRGLFRLGGQQLYTRENEPGRANACIDFLKKGQPFFRLGVQKCSLGGVEGGTTVQGGRCCARIYARHLASGVVVAEWRAVQCL